MKSSITSLINTHRAEIMGVAALWIFVYHDWTWLIPDTGIFTSILRLFSFMGVVGVEMFLFLSGIGMVYAIEKYPTAIFYKRRLTRILPAYALTIILAAIIRQWDFWYFLKTISSYHFWTQSMYIIQWFGTTIIVYYLAFPLYYAGMKKARNSIIFTLVMLAVWYLVSIAVEGVMRDELYGFTNRIPVFMAGILCGWTAKRRTVVFSRGAWMSTMLMWCCGLVCFYLVLYRGVRILVPDSVKFLPSFLLGVSSVCILAGLFSLLAQYGGKAGQRIRKVMAFYGKISFEVYCIQDLLGLIISTQEHFLPSVIFALVSLAETTVLAYILYVLCKKIGDGMVRMRWRGIALTEKN